MADNGSDLQLVFGVDENPSYGNISDGLKALLEKIAGDDYKVVLGADFSKAESEIDRFRNSIKDITATITIDKSTTGIDDIQNIIKTLNRVKKLTDGKKYTLDLDLSKAKISESDANNFSLLVNALAKLDPAKLEGLKDIDLSKLQNLHIDEKSATSIQSLVEAITQLQLLQSKALSGGGSGGGGVIGVSSNINKLQDELKIIDEYYARMKDVVKLREDVKILGDGSDGFVSISGANKSLADQTNAVASAYNALMASIHAAVEAERTGISVQDPSTLSKEDMYKVLQRNTEKAQEYERYVESLANKEQAAAEKRIATAEKVAEKERVAEQKSAAKQDTQYEKAHYDEIISSLKEYYKLLDEIAKTPERAKDATWSSHLKQVTEDMNVLTAAESTRILTEQHQKEVEDTIVQKETEHAQVLEDLARAENERAAAAQASAEAKVETQAYTELKNIVTEISSLELDLFKMNPEKDAAEISAVTKRLEELHARYNEIFNDDRINLTSEHVKELADLWEKLGVKAERAGAQQQDAARNERMKEKKDLLEDVKKLYDDIANGSKHLSTADQGRLDVLKGQLEGGKLNADELKRYRAEYEALSRSATKGMGDASNGLNMLQNRIVRMFSLVEIVRRVWKEIKEMVKAVKELDTAMTQLQIVTGATNTEYEQYGETVAKTAKEIGSSITDLINSTTTYARLGYSLNESASLAKYTSMLKNVGAIDVSAAQDAITAVTKAFDVGVEDIEDTMDKMVAVGNHFPISVSQIAAGMNNAGSSLAAAGNSLQESIALLTAANTTVQNISKASTGVRTLSARIRKTGVDLDELGETIETAKYEEVINNLTKHNVLLTTANGEYKSTYEIMKEIAGVWEELTSMEQAAVAEQLAGKIVVLPVRTEMCA